MHAPRHFYASLLHAGEHRATQYRVFSERAPAADGPDTAHEDAWPSDPRLSQ